MTRTRSQSTHTPDQRDSLSGWTPPISTLLRCSRTAVDERTHPVPSATSRQNQGDIDDLEDAYLTIANVIAAYGDTYLPIFRRLHDEREARTKEQSYLELAHLVSKKRE